MGQEEVNGPPKKKLKQAQLSFCSTSPNSTNKHGSKRKLCEESETEVQSSKIVCRESDLLKCNPDEDKNVKELHNDDNLVPEALNEELDKRNESTEPSTSEKEACDAPDSTYSISVPKTEEVPKEDIECSANEQDSEVSKEISHNKSEDNVLDSDCLDNNHTSEDKTPEKTVEESSSSQSTKVENAIVNKENNNETNKDSNLSLLNLSTDTESDDTKKSPVTPKRKLTPKQILKKLESEKKRKEKDRLKKEKEMQKALMKEEKEKRRQEELRQKEEEKRLKEEDRKKKEEDKKKKEEEKKKKEEEKKKKEEEKKKKEDEKKKKEEAKEEEKKKREEAKLIEKRKASQASKAFVNYFVPKKDSGQEKECDPPATIFMPFQIKSDMRLAEISRTSISDENRNALDDIGKGSFANGDKDLYLEKLKSTKHIPKSSEATWPLSALEEQHDVIIIESLGDEEENVDMDSTDIKSKTRPYKAKLLQFHDNRRPPYWGTWRKKSEDVTPRRPLGKDTVVFDYEVDSDSEWEDEEEGESLEDGDDADKEQSDDEEVGENGYLLDNTFVPHGYLSDEEAQEEDENISPEEQKLRLIVMKEEFDEEMKQKAERLKPRLLGCVWISNETTEVSKGSLYQTLLTYRAVWDESIGNIDIMSMTENESPPSTPTVQSKSKTFPKSIVEPLAKLVHGSQLSLKQLVKEFLIYLEKENSTQCISKNAVTRKIKDIARRSYDSNGKQSWTVNDEMCMEFGLKSIEKQLESPPQENSEKVKDTFLDSFLKNHQSQTPKKRVQFVTLSRGEKTAGRTEKAVETPKVDKVFKKRVPLISFPRTPENQKQNVHVDTPRPATNPFVEICPDDSNKETKAIDLCESPIKLEDKQNKPDTKDASDIEKEDKSENKEKNVSKISPKATISSFFKRSPKQTVKKEEPMEIVTIDSDRSEEESAKNQPIVEAINVIDGKV